MWFLWILITLLIQGISLSQVFSFFYAIFTCQKQYNKLSPAKRTRMSIGIIIHSSIVIIWMILCFTIDAINRYWLVLLFTWIIGSIFTIFVVAKNRGSILSALVEDEIENPPNNIDKTSQPTKSSPANLYSENHNNQKNITPTSTNNSEEYLANWNASHFVFRNIIFSMDKDIIINTFFKKGFSGNSEDREFVGMLLLALYNEIEKRNLLNIDQLAESVHFYQRDTLKILIIELNLVKHPFESQYIYLIYNDEKIYYCNVDFISPKSYVITEVSTSDEEVYPLKYIKNDDLDDITDTIIKLFT